MEYYSAIKRNEIGSSVETWMDLETVIQSKVSQKEKKVLYINTYMWNLEKCYDGILKMNESGLPVLMMACRS